MTEEFYGGKGARKYTTDGIQACNRLYQTRNKELWGGAKYFTKIRMVYFLIRNAYYYKCKEVFLLGIGMSHQSKKHVYIEVNIYITLMKIYIIIYLERVVELEAVNERGKVEQFVYPF